MHIYDIYGSYAEEGSLITDSLENMFGVKFSSHESEHFGEYFLAQTSKGGFFKILRNLSGEEWHEEEYKNFPWIIRTGEFFDADMVFHKMKAFKNITFLYRSEVKEKEWMRRYKYTGEMFELLDEFRF